MDKKRIIQVDEKVPLPMLLPLSIQHVFAMFGASVLVPILFQIDPGILLHSPCYIHLLSLPYLRLWE